MKCYNIKFTKKLTQKHENLISMFRNETAQAYSDMSSKKVSTPFILVCTKQNKGGDNSMKKR